VHKVSVLILITFAAVSLVGDQRDDPGVGEKHKRPTRIPQEPRERAWLR
jgi:hypothetical protein